MVDTVSARPNLNGSAGVLTQSRTRNESASDQSSSLNGVEITRISTEVSELPSEGRSRFHIYHMNEAHRTISPTVEPSKERYWGPKLKEEKSERKARKQLREEGPTEADTDDSNGAFFLHSPYLAFHAPPSVLYMGNTKYAKPVVFIHETAFWTKYKLQIGPSLAIPGVLDPRGVVAWRHNGGDSQALKADDRKLKGYKVRTWRLWGESGKDYVHTVKANREDETCPDPDVLDEMRVEPVRAEEVVYLRWMNPLSRQTRCYHFRYVGMDFYWKGTGTVKESRRCGFFVRFCHLKLVAKIPLSGEDGEDCRDVCLAKYTSSVAAKKSGILELFDAAMLRLAEEHAPSMLERNPFEDQLESEQRANNGDAENLRRLKRSTLYQVIVATAMCMINGEKQKRETIAKVLEAGGEGGSGGGG